MHKLIDFFIDKARLNYTLMLFLFILGVVAYHQTSKELFPAFEMDKVVISGGYAGASADTLDKMAVTEIEDQVQNINGIQKTTSVIQAGGFSIELELESGSDKREVLDEVKDGITIVQQDLPSDMDEPTARVKVNKIPLIQVSVASNTIGRDALVDVSKAIKSELSKIENLTDIAIYGEGEREIEIEVDTRKLKAYGLDTESLYRALQGVSYIYPVGKIEETGRHRYVSTFNGPKSAESFLDTIIAVNGKRLYVRDIATIVKHYGESDTLSSFNGKVSININVAKDDEGNAIALAQKVKDRLEELTARYPEVSLTTYSDTSTYIRNRLNTVSSNILFGLILVTLTMFLLINKRIAFIVALGVPTSFIIGTIFIYYGGYSINMMTLLGALLAIGVIVDDAIIVAENIQRHLSEGMSPMEAARKGAKEVAAPVLTASLTTIFAFVPMLMLTGEMGEFIKFIPIAVTVLIIASLIESFIFLPLHARHVLHKNEKEMDWGWLSTRYEKLLSFLIHYRKSSVVLFLIFVPLFTVIGFSQIKFQFFPKFDSTQLYVAGRLSIDHDVEQSFEIARKIEQQILEEKKTLFIESVASIGGFQMDQKNEGEIGENLFFMFIDLETAAPDNIVERYITPYLSFDYDDGEKPRTLKSYDAEAQLRALLKDAQERYGLEEFEVRSQSAGVVKTDIELTLSHDDDVLLLKALERLEGALSQIGGVKNISNDAKSGVKELKMRLNDYGASLGLNEQLIASQLAGYYLGNTRGRSFDDKGLVDMIIKDNRRDQLAHFKHFSVRVPVTNQEVALGDVVEFITLDTFAKIKKENGAKIKTLFANVNADVITATEVIEQLDPMIEQLRGEGVIINLKGEQEKKEQLMHDMMIAWMIAMFLMFITLLTQFNSLKYTFMVLSVIPLSIVGVLVGHLVMGMNMTMPSVIGALGLAGVVINDGIIMLDFIRKTSDSKGLLQRATLRLRPVLLTSITTLAGLSTLIFFASGQAKILQPLAVSLGFGLFWGTVLNLLYLPTLYAILNKIKEVK